MQDTLEYLTEHFPRQRQRWIAGIPYLLYADDTVFFAPTAREMQRMLTVLETVAARYGLRLNEARSVWMATGPARNVRFANGQAAPCAEDVKYLGVNLNVCADIRREVLARLGAVRRKWQKLAPFYKHSSCSAKSKIQIIDSVLRSQLLYGLESAWVNDSELRKIDALQMRILRQILKVKSTYVDR